MRAIILGLLLLWPAYVSAQTKRVALIVIDFTASVQPDPNTMLWQRIDADVVQAFYAEQSYGRASLTIDTFGVFRVPLDENAADYFAIEREAQAAAISAGMDASAYTGFVYVYPITTPPHPNIARGSNVFISLWRGKVLPAGFRVLAHELGHAQFGMTHARGAGQELGDVFDVMGSGMGHFNNIKKSGRWLDPEQIQSVNESGDYVLTPLATAGGLKGIIISGGNKLAWSYVFEYRQPGQHESSGFVRPENYNGALARITLNGGELLFFNEEISTFDKRPALMVGQRWCNKDARFSVTTLSATPEALTLRVRFGNCR